LLRRPASQRSGNLIEFPQDTARAAIQYGNALRLIARLRS
jgi:hypothetical protein